MNNDDLFFGLHRYLQGKHICGHEDLFFGLHRFLVEEIEFPTLLKFGPDCTV